MPCFKGLAVSIHADGDPLPEYATKKQTRLSRINSYIAVPPAKIPQSSTSGIPEQSKFAISITLLCPGQPVPYSAPKSTPENPYPQPQIVASYADVGSLARHRLGFQVHPYMPLTSSRNETIAAYIYFDGRAKEEVATLLRRGEETWVNSRWVGLPESEGGGLAEREFLFREVGLERWLNGLDLEGTDAAAKIERRRQKMEKKRRRRLQQQQQQQHNRPDSDDEAESSASVHRSRLDKGAMRYGADSQSPLETLSDSDGMFLSQSDSDDDPVPEAAGQIKVALFRVLASGEIRKGEYSPQFDAHDDSTEGGGKMNEGDTEEVDHTTSFAQPKTLDPKTISTQTVTGIDATDRPFATFTFLYRGEKQLQKMGVIPTPSKTPDKSSLSNGTNRKSMEADFAKLKPLSGSSGLKTFTEMRDPSDRLNGGGDKADKNRKKRRDADSDDDLDVEAKAEEAGAEPSKETNAMLSPEDARQTGELAEGVQKIRLKRQHSTTDLTAPSPAPARRKSPPSTAGSSPSGPNQPLRNASPPLLLPSLAFENPALASSTSTGAPTPASAAAAAAAIVGSPLKKQRASLSNHDDEEMRRRFGLGVGGGRGDVLAGVGGGSSNSTSAAAGGGGGGKRDDSHDAVPDFGGLLPAPASAPAPALTPAGGERQDRIKEEVMEEEEL